MNALSISRSDWLSPHRARLYSGALAGALLVFVTSLGILTLMHRASRPVALDFSAFWSASRLALSGHAASAYDPAIIETIERSATDMAPGYLAFYYPPSFLLLILPLGLTSYSLALAFFIVIEMALVLAALRRILPARWTWLPLLSFPGFVMNGLSGQNAALSAACFAGTAIWLERSPLLAGACLGALCCKPQLAVCVPVALLSARRWRALTGSLFTTIGLALASAIAFGANAWRGFLDGAVLARTDIETIPGKWPKLQSLYGAIRLLGGGNTGAYAAQVVFSLTVVALLSWTCWSRPGRMIETAALASSALLVTPFLYDYDLTILIVPLTCMAAVATQTGWRNWEHLVLSVVFILPLAARPAGLLLNITLGPPIVIAFLLLITRRARPPATHQRWHADHFRCDASGK